MTEQLNESSEKIQSEGRQPNVAVDPRLQSSHGSDDLENDYQFFRMLVKNNIFQLTNVSGTSDTVQFIRSPIGGDIIKLLFCFCVTLYVI